MASVALLTSAGVSSSAMPFKLRSVDLVTYAGIAVANGVVDWAGSANPLSKVPWLPKAGTPLLLPDSKGQKTNQLNPAWDRAIRWLFEEYIGGISAPTISQVAQNISDTQAQVAVTANYAEQAVSYSAGIAAAVSANTEVARAAGLPGSESVPEVPDRPAPPTAIP